MGADWLTMVADFDLVLAGERDVLACKLYAQRVFVECSFAEHGSRANRLGYLHCNDLTTNTLYSNHLGYEGRFETSIAKASRKL